MAPTPEEQKACLLNLGIHKECGLNWSADLDLAAFDGVTVDASGRVTGLNLHNKIKEDHAGFHLDALAPILTELLTELDLGSEGRKKIPVKGGSTLNERERNEKLSC